MEIDYIELRNDLMNYFGTAMSYNPMAVVNLTEVQYASEEKLIEIALSNGFDLSNYTKSKRL